MHTRIVLFISLLTLSAGKEARPSCKGASCAVPGEQLLIQRSKVRLSTTAGAAKEQQVAVANATEDDAKVRRGVPCRHNHCVVPAGQHWVIDSNVDVETMTVHGTLQWDTEIDGIELRTGHLKVTSTGRFEVGTKSRPMNKKATIYIKKTGHSDSDCGNRFVCSVGGGDVEMHGRELQSWTMLSNNGYTGQNFIYLKDDINRMGWRAGDHIGIATTSRGISSTYTIDRFAPVSEWELNIADVSSGKADDTQQWGEVMSNAIDGSTGSTWGSWCAPHCGNGDTHWLGAHLDQSAFVTKARVWFTSTRYAPRFHVAVKPSGGGDWVHVRTITNGQEGWNDVPVEREARAVKITADFESMKHRSGEPEWTGISVGEFQVFGRTLGVPTPIVAYLTEPLKDDHWGGMRKIKSREFELAAEVLNLERSILITGDHGDFDSSKQGLHTLFSGHGLADVRYTRVEYCGQRDVMGRYCLHFHRKKDCPTCMFKGNAVWNSMQIGITVHDTHRSNVEDNAIWDGRAAGIYVEDGNEMHNTFRNNAMVCSWWETCSVRWQGNVNQVGGMFVIGMTNNFIGNHVAGHENGAWFNGAARGNGHGNAAGKVCPQYTPFGEIRGNVMHDCNRFGLYPDNQHPRKITRDADGYVTDRSTCNEFDADGNDNGIVPANVILDEMDYHNMFVGSYAMGDVRWERFTSINNAAPIYYKTSKMFADGSMWHVKDSVFVSDSKDTYGALNLLSAGGPFTFGMKNVKFIGGPTQGGALKIGQHCGRVGAGSPCNTQYFLEDVDFSEINEGEPWVKFGINELDPGALVLPTIIARDNSLGGYKTIMTQHMNGFARLDGCEPAGEKWENGIGCNFEVRRVNYWSQNVGDLKISGPGYEVGSNHGHPALGMNAGKMLYSAQHGGYGASVILGREYNIDGNIHGEGYFEFSDRNLATYLGGDEVLRLRVKNRECELHAFENRQRLGTHGDARGAYRADRGCRGFGSPSPAPGPRPPSPGPAPRPPSPGPAPPPPPAPGPEPSTSAPSSNHYRKESGVGGWGGICTCPDGQRYNVGDKWDGCRNGPASLSCYGGTPGECVKEVDSSREGMVVTCAAAPSTPAPAPEPATPAPSNNNYRRKSGVGGWGGWCTCPDGQRYNVGDLRDGCANGPASLACFGGTPGECVKEVDASREGMAVTCGGAPAPTPAAGDCNPAAWSGYDGQTCGSCAALVKVNGGSCNDFCQRQGLGCANGWDDTTNEQCSPDAPKMGCGHAFADTSDAVCQCEPKAPCVPESWSGYDGRKCGNCAALVKVRDNGGSCEAFCREQGLRCVDGWDDTTDEQCSENAPKLGCGFAFTTTSDGICQCE